MMSRGAGRPPRLEPAGSSNSGEVGNALPKEHERGPWAQLADKNEAKASPLAAILCRMFNDAARRLAWPVPQNKVRRKHRSGDTGRAFSPAAAQTARRVFLREPLDRAVTDFMWDAFAWLHLWESNDQAAFHESCGHFDTAEQNYLSLHL
jgi:hypothetical protein